MKDLTTIYLLINIQSVSIIMIGIAVIVGK